MSDTSKYHVTLEEKQNWDNSGTEINTHVANTAIHVPNPPIDGKEYYLGNDLNWHLVPKVTIL